ncbi:amino acid permease [Caldinitratiruptor microaerophilus]|uniref:Amino acid transporter n=1 Tax=Caldinitratiruptor microaerophilus TaxID=671077 RepID=A0AA35CJ12_9FIRM|nr:amino acid permease [Caldinitratiruptor microaerophilus]BDG60164.1 amino acid transporter [Caldinitratiruptor microaerophilus]
MSTVQREVEQLERDRRELHRYGYAQELFRDMGGFSNFAISFSIISILTGAVSLYGYGFTMGGPAVNGLGWPLVTFFTLFVAAAMAELASAIPTSGAIYHWSHVLGGRAWGWFAAWFNLVGQFTITAGIDWSVSLFLTPLLGLEETWGNFLAVYAVVLLSHGILKHYGIRVVARLNDLSAWWHMGGVALLVGALLIFAPKRDLSYLFETGFTTTSYPYWWAFLLGLLQAQWTYTGYDASAHVTEETINPRVRAAWGVYLAVAVSAFFGYVMLAAVTLAIRDPQAVAAATNPYITAIEQALGGVFGRAMLWIVTIAMWFCGLSSVTANSRMIFAFARDRGLPGHRWLGTVSRRYRTPAAAVWLAVVVAFLFAVYAEALPIITSISTIALYVSYGIPMALKLWARARGAWTSRNDGPWNLGPLSTLVNVLAILWILFISVLFVAPPNEKTGYTFAVVLAALVLYWVAVERHRFEGPRRLGTEDELERIERALEQESLWRRTGRVAT